MSALSSAVPDGKAMQPLVQRTRTKLLLLAADACAALLLAWYFLPALRDIGRKELFAAALVGFLVLSACVKPRWLQVFGKYAALLGMWFAVFALNYLLGRALLFFEYSYVMTVFFAPALLFLYYEDTLQQANLVMLSRLVLLCLCVTAVTTIIGQFVHPGASRLMSTGVVDWATARYSRENIGGFGFSYALMLYSIPFASLLCGPMKPLHRALLIGMLALFLAAIFKAAFTICILFAVVGVGLSLLLRRYRMAYLVVVAALAGFLMLLFSGLLLEMAQNLIGLVTSPEIATRLMEILKSLQHGELTGDLFLRVNKYFVSIQTLLSHPLIGVGGFYGYNSEDFGIGGHAELFDLLARYGLIGAAPIVLCFSFWFAHTRKRYREAGSGLYGSLVLYQWVFLALSCVNTMFTSTEIGAIVFFAIPALRHLERKRF